jgi:cell division protein FtsN
MSDYRNSDYDYRNSNDPLRRNPPFDPDERAMNATWGWIAAAIFVVVILAVAFGIGHEPGQQGTTTASNDIAPPAATRMAPPVTPAPPAKAAPPAATPAPMSPMPNTPAQRSQP